MYYQEYSDLDEFEEELRELDLERNQQSIILDGHQ